MENIMTTANITTDLVGNLVNHYLPKHTHCVGNSFFSMRVGNDKYIFVTSLELENELVYCPNPPYQFNTLVTIHGITWNEAASVWFSYWEKVRNIFSKSPKFKIIGKEKTYNCNNGKLSFVINGKLYTVNNQYIEPRTLESLGFSKDSHLFVPFSNNEGYYREDWNSILSMNG